MKAYTPEPLAAIRRYQNYIPTLPPRIRDAVQKRMAYILTSIG